MTEKTTYVGPGRESAPAVMLRDVGPALFGTSWQSDLAKALTPLHPKAKRVTQPMVARWAAGTRTIPTWVWKAILDVMYEREVWMRDRREPLLILASMPLAAGHDGEEE